uniref:Uncharacterized protein n=1 Tax=viral metagenome TaxID=1070528 RepID=A0A6C0HZ98_9ZZZZ
MSVNAIELIQALKNVKKSIGNSILELHASNKQTEYDECVENFTFIKNIPIVRNLTNENVELKRQLKILKKHNRRLEKLVIKQNLEKLYEPVHVKSRDLGNMVYEIVDDDEEEIIKLDGGQEIIQKDDEKISTSENISFEKVEVEDKVLIININENSYYSTNGAVIEEEEEGDENEEEIEEEEQEEVVEGEEEQEEVVEGEEEQEEVVEEEEQEEVVEEEDEEGEEEGEVYEVIIKGKTYYVTNEIDSIIYNVDDNGDISIEVGQYKNGKPIMK